VGRHTFVTVLSSLTIVISMPCRETDMPGKRTRAQQMIVVGPDRDPRGGSAEKIKEKVHISGSSGEHNREQGFLG